MYKNLIHHSADGVSLLQLNRPQKKNALNGELRNELQHAIEQMARDKDIRAVVLSGGEEFFCAGADIGEIQESRSAEAAYHHAREFQMLFDRIEALPQPVIAAVAGFALGGGCELTLACDFRLAAEGAKFGLPEIKIGAFPGGGGTQRLPRLVGVAKAKEMIFTGEPVTADEALALGLVSKVVPKEALMDEARNFAAKLASLPRLALQASKMLINRSVEMDLASGLEMEARTFSALALTHDLSEGIRAFLDKRKPNFTGN